jgi:hypothetical protein
MAEVCIISANMVKKYTQINSAVDDNFIYAAMYVAQDKYLTSYLGDSLMEKIKTDISGSGLSGNYITLVDKYVRKALVWWTMVELVPILTYKGDNASFVQRTLEDGQGVSDDVMKDIMYRARNNAESYSTKLADYLCANSSLFPEFNDNVWPQKPASMTTTPTTSYGFSHGNTATSGTAPFKRISQLP